jgi:hypothetical protein
MVRKRDIDRESQKTLYRDVYGNPPSSSPAATPLGVYVYTIRLAAAKSIFVDKS